MNIKVTFLNGSNYWQQLVLNSAEKASDILSDPAFLLKISNITHYDFCIETPIQIGDKIRAVGEITIEVGFYSKWFTKAIAYEECKKIWFNTRKKAYGAGGVGNIVHETLHALGYKHNGNATAGNEFTVPYLIGDLADGWVLTKPTHN